MVVTAYADVSLRALALEAGANDFILSPLDHNAFRAQSRSLLEMRRSGQLTAPAISAHQDRLPDPDASSTQTGLFNSLVETLATKLLLKTGEISRLSAEMNILLEATETSAVFVDGDLIIRQFTKASSEIYALKAQDLGRSLLHVECKLDYGQLADDFRQVQLSGTTFERYLQSRFGRRHYRLRLVPVTNGLAPVLGAPLIFSPIPAWHERASSVSVH